MVLVEAISAAKAKKKMVKERKCEIEMIVDPIAKKTFAKRPAEIIYERSRLKKDLFQPYLHNILLIIPVCGSVYG